MQSPPNKVKFIVGQFPQNLTMSMQRLNHFHGFLPEYQPYLSPASPIRRGPMYSAYAELREWRLRTKAAMIKPPPSPPPPPSLHVGLRKEEKQMAKLPSNVAKMDIPGMTPRLGSKADMRRLGSVMAMKKSNSGLKDMKEMKDFPHAFMASSFDGGVYKEDKVLNKVMLNRSVASFRGHAFYNDYNNNNNNKMGKLKS